MEIISNVALITINETIIVQAGSFLIFLFLLNRIMIKPLRVAIAERDQYMENARRDVIAANQKISDLTAQISAQESSAKEEAFGQCRQLETDGGKSAAEIIAETRQAISVERNKALKEINVQITAARKAIEVEAESMAVNAMEKVLNRGLT